MLVMLTLSVPREGGREGEREGGMKWVRKDGVKPDERKGGAMTRR